MKIKSVIKKLFYAGLTAGTIGAAGLVGFYSYLATDLPDVRSFTPTFSEPLRVYDRNGDLIASYGAERRITLTYDQFPKVLRDAVVAIEDRRFYEHGGIDPRSIARAAFVLVTTGHKSQGASTITQQLARNFFLSSKKEFIRKFKEMILAVRMERSMTKEEILAAYMNKIYLGHRSYGFAEAARTYFNKNVDDLTLPEAALLAGIQQAPSQLNPIASLERATARRNQVLAAMLSTNSITQAEYDEAVKTPVVVNPGRVDNQGVGYVSEMVRQALYNKYGEKAYTQGFKVYTTVDNQLQREATLALRNNLIAFDQRKGWREKDNERFLYSGNQELVEYRDAQHLVLKVKEANGRESQRIITLTDLINRFKLSGFATSYEPLVPVVVLSVSKEQAQVVDINGNIMPLPLSSMSWAGKYINADRKGAAPKDVNELLRIGQVVYVETKLGNTGMVAELRQIPNVNSGLISLNSTDGAIEAMVGGFSYSISKFNRATQATVQVGSSFKPFLYAAAFEKFSPMSNRALSWGTVMRDEPIAIRDNDKIWKPKNSGDVYKGDITLRQAFAESRNIIAVKLMQQVGTYYMSRFLQRLGFQQNTFMPTLSLALGTANFTPLEMARAYAAFDNGGFLINPYLITKIEDNDGTVIYQANPLVACTANSDECNSIAPLDPITDNTEMQSASNANLIDLDLNNQNLGASEDLDDLIRQNTQTRSVDQSQAATATDAGLVDDAQASQNNRYAPRVLSADVAWLMWSGLNSNIYGRPGFYYGTGARAAQELKAKDIGGKTGTTNDSKSAWFVGYANKYVTATFVAYDNATTLGRREFGGGSALSNWIAFEKLQLAQVSQPWMRPMPNSLQGYLINAQGYSVSSGGYTEFYPIPLVPPTQPQGTDLDLNSEENGIF
ncbi:hypothetical protein CJP74_03810 [Psittacicella melopsittaci]|uniref:Penicillin-binding protein 1A n=1 Tax=Psittacicella melopsittaci TaxID=2028576 RepID=A0A3A1Y5J0_9GAMM|nr:transglycosylase domain-containing protein [Psittacicella melopsittaci]RIY32741.1 hypothetical protein CJP74_03810 [Psittacicella melopsittaci]